MKNNKSKLQRQALLRGAATLARAPIIVFNRKDALQWRFVRRITRARLAPPMHYLPTATGFIDAAALGLGWCLAPQALVQPALQAGRVVCIDPERWLDVPLHWQQARAGSALLDGLTQCVMEAARVAGLSQISFTTQSTTK